MQLTFEQVVQMAPDEASISAGKKMQAARYWLRLGQNEQALWGECQGSALYQVRIEQSAAGYKCNCPSRKFPCKHVLGLLMLAATTPAALPQLEAPDWIVDWLAQRQATALRKEAKATKESPVDEKAQQKRAEQRQDRVRDGVETLERWLRDLMRRGLAGLENQGNSLWEEQARRLVDAQAPGLALQMRRLGELPGSSPDWPALLLQELGRLKLALHAFHRVDQLNPALALSLRQYIGWVISSDELEKVGEKVTDHWLIVGQWIDEDKRLRTQRSWFIGKETGRYALMLQFVPGSGAFPIPLRAGMMQQGTMLFYPGSANLRTQFIQRAETSSHLASIPGHESLEAFLAQVATQLASQPWLSAFPAALRQVTLCQAQQRWHLRDAAGQALPLREFDRWKLLALSGGMPFDFFGEWSGQQLRPLAACVDGGYRSLA